MTDRHDWHFRRESEGDDRSDTEGAEVTAYSGQSKAQRAKRDSFLRYGVLALRNNTLRTTHDAITGTLCAMREKMRLGISVRKQLYKGRLPGRGNRR